jgi:hypothetical protein
MSRELKQLVEEIINEKLNEDISNYFKRLIFVEIDRIQQDRPGEDFDGEEIIQYNILNSSRKHVGEVQYDTYFGDYRGNLYNKEFKFEGRGDDPKKNMESWFKSNSFKKWVANIDKYKELKAPTNNYRLKSNRR